MTPICPPVVAFIFIVAILVILDMIVNIISGSSLVGEFIKALLSLLGVLVVSIILWLLCTFLPVYKMEITSILAVIGIIIKALQSILNLGMVVL